MEGPHRLSRPHASPMSVRTARRHRPEIRLHAAASRLVDDAPLERRRTAAAAGVSRGGRSRRSSGPASSPAPRRSAAANGSTARWSAPLRRRAALAGDAQHPRPGRLQHGGQPLHALHAASRSSPASFARCRGRCFGCSSIWCSTSARSFRISPPRPARRSFASICGPHARPRNRATSAGWNGSRTACFCSRDRAADLRRQGLQLDSRA